MRLPRSIDAEEGLGAEAEISALLARRPTLPDASISAFADEGGLMPEEPEEE